MYGGYGMGRGLGAWATSLQAPVNHGVVELLAAEPWLDGAEAVLGVGALAATMSPGGRQERTVLVMEAGREVRQTTRVREIA